MNPSYSIPEKANIFGVAPNTNTSTNTNTTTNNVRSYIDPFSIMNKGDPGQPFQSKITSGFGNLTQQNDANTTGNMFGQAPSHMFNKTANSYPLPSAANPNTVVNTGMIAAAKNTNPFGNLIKPPPTTTTTSYFNNSSSAVPKNNVSSGSPFAKLTDTSFNNQNNQNTQKTSFFLKNTPANNTSFNMAGSNVGNTTNNLISPAQWFNKTNNQTQPTNTSQMFQNAQNNQQVNNNPNPLFGQSQVQNQNFQNYQNQSASQFYPQGQNLQMPPQPTFPGYANMQTHQQQFTNNYQNNTPYQIAPQLYPQQVQPTFTQYQNTDYYTFLNSLTNNDPINETNNPKKLFQPSQQWINTMIRPNFNQSQEHAMTEYMKLHDTKTEPTLRQTNQRPFELNYDLMSKLNEPITCRMIASQVWLRLKDRLDACVKSINELSHNYGYLRLKQLPFFDAVSTMRKDLKVLASKLSQLKGKKAQLLQFRSQCAEKYKESLQKYKEAFCEVNTRMKMLAQGSSEVEKMSEYVQSHLKTAYEAFQAQKQTTIYEPDYFMLEISQFIAKRLSLLEKAIDDRQIIEGDTQESTNFLELTENMCRFYEEVATKLYDIRLKMKNLVQTVSKFTSFGGYQNLQKKIEEKSKAIISQKMTFYEKLKQAEQIIEKKGYGSGSRKKETNLLFEAD